MESILSDPKLLITIISGLVGLVIAIIGMLLYRKAGISESWPTTTGIVLTSDVKKETNSSNKGTVISYKPEICYSYKVAGNEYISNNIRQFLDPSSGSSVKAFKIARKYPLNSKLTIYYNPDKPKEAFIEPGSKARLKTVMVIGLVILVISLIIALEFGLKDVI